MRERLVLLLLTAVVLAPWGPVDWVWDDVVLVAENPNLGWGRLLTMWGEDLWAGAPGEHAARYHRPLMVGTLVLDQQLLGGSALGARLHSLAWHLLAVGLLHRVLRGSPAALLGAALYALHPVATELVHFVAARNDTMAVCAILGVLLLMEGQPKTGRRALAGLVLFAGLLSKESAVVAVLALVARDLGVSRNLRFARYVELGVGGFAALLLRAAVPLESPPLAVEPSVALAALSELGLALVAPWLAAPAAAPTELVGVGVLGLVGLALVVVPGHRSAWGAAVLWSGLGLAVVGAVLSDGVAWRYMALPLLGLSISAAGFRLPAWPAWGVAAVLGALTVLVKPMWSDDVRFRLENHDRQPQPATACGAFKTLELVGERQAAADLLPEALPREHCCYNASRFWLDGGDPVTAVTFGELALSSGCPASPELTAPIGLGAAVTEDWDRALHYASMHEGRDPYGYSKVVLTAEGLRRGDRTALERFGGSPELEARAVQLLD